MKKGWLYILLAFGLLTDGCSRKEHDKPGGLPTESRQAKALFQGVWTDQDAGDVMFQAKGDTIWYPDSTSQPAYFAFYNDSLFIGSASYGIARQTEHIFWLINQNGDTVKLVKNDNPETEQVFVKDEAPRVLTYTEVVERDSVVMYGGERYHWYVTINPTRYKVPVKSYNADGIEVVNVYYDNIIHISIFHGTQKLFSTDVRKQMYSNKIPASFLQEAILSNMEFVRVDEQGFHFDATVCHPDGASCYRIDNMISKDGRMNTKLVEY